MEMIIDCSLFTLGANITILKDGETILAIPSIPMDHKSIGGIIKDNKVNTVYVKGAKNFVARLSGQLTTDFNKTNVKIVCIG